MNLKNTAERYSTLSIAMHSLVLLLLVAVYLCIKRREKIYLETNYIFYRGELA